MYNYKILIVCEPKVAVERTKCFWNEPTHCISRQRLNMIKYLVLSSLALQASFELARGIHVREMLKWNYNVRSYCRFLNNIVRWSLVQSRKVKSTQCFFSAKTRATCGLQNLQNGNSTFHDVCWGSLTHT